MFADGRLDPDFSVAESLGFGRTPGIGTGFSVARNGDYLVTQDSSNPVLHCLREEDAGGDSSLRSDPPGGLRSAAYVRENAIGTSWWVGTYNSGIIGWSAQGSPTTCPLILGYWEAYQGEVCCSAMGASGFLAVHQHYGSFPPGLVLSRQGTVPWTRGLTPGWEWRPRRGSLYMTEDPQGRVLWREASPSLTACLPRDWSGFLRNPGLVWDPPNPFYARLLRSTAPECGAPQQVRVTRAGDLEGRMRCRCGPSPIPQWLGRIFVPLDTTLVFGPGERFKTVTLKMVADQVPERTRLLLRVGPTRHPKPGFPGGDPRRVDLEPGLRGQFSTNRIRVGEDPAVLRPEFLEFSVLPHGEPLPCT